MMTYLDILEELQFHLPISEIDSLSISSPHEV